MVLSDDGGGGGGDGGDGGVKLFGVELRDGPSINRSASMGSLSLTSYSRSSSAASPDSYLSDDLTHHSSSTHCPFHKTKGMLWTEEEHRMFLVGLRKLGKGDWRGISHDYVTSRTPTQVASHAQKYFTRHRRAHHTSRRRRRFSLFDMPPPTVSLEPVSVRDLDPLLCFFCPHSITTVGFMYLNPTAVIACEEDPNPCICNRK